MKLLLYVYLFLSFTIPASMIAGIPEIDVKLGIDSVSIKGLWQHRIALCNINFGSIKIPLFFQHYLEKDTNGNENSRWRIQNLYASFVPIGLEAWRIEIPPVGSFKILKAFGTGSRTRVQGVLLEGSDDHCLKASIPGLISWDFKDGILESISVIQKGEYNVSTFGSRISEIKHDKFGTILVARYDDEGNPIEIVAGESKISLMWSAPHRLDSVTIDNENTTRKLNFLYINNIISKVSDSSAKDIEVQWGQMDSVVKNAFQYESAHYVKSLTENNTTSYYEVSASSKGYKLISRRIRSVDSILYNPVLGLVTKSVGKGKLVYKLETNSSSPAFGRVRSIIDADGGLETNIYYDEIGRPSISRNSRSEQYKWVMGVPVRIK